MTIQEAEFARDLIRREIAQEERRRSEAEKVQRVLREAEAARKRLSALRGETLDVLV